MPTIILPEANIARKTCKYPRSKHTWINISGSHALDDLFPILSIPKFPKA
jgi:hypothetical protein